MTRKWTEPDGYSPNKDEFDQLDDYGWRIGTVLKLLAVVALVIWGLSYPARSVADCRQTFADFSNLDCLRVWVYGVTH